MPYQQGYQQPNYAVNHQGHGYGAPPSREATQMYQMQTHLPQQQQEPPRPVRMNASQSHGLSHGLPYPRREVSQFSPTSPQASFYTAPSQPDFHGQYQQAGVPLQQYYYSQGQQFHSQHLPQQPVQFQQHSQYQQPQQPVYQQPVRQSPVQASPQFQFRQPPTPSVQSSPPLQYQGGSQPFHQGSQSFHQFQTPASQPVQQSRPQVHTSRPQQRSQQSFQASQPPTPVQHHPQQRVIARVEIPVQKPIANPADFEMGRSPKRRRSNEGHAVPVCAPPVPQKRAAPAPTPAPVKPEPVSSSPLTELASSQLPPPPTPKVKTDYPAMLLSLADEYVDAAYGLGIKIASGNASDEQSEEYSGLMSTAMGCLESVLKNYRQTDPRQEARIRLRLASLLLDETDNDAEAQEILSKGLSLCERSRLPDLKYAMHHLLAQATFKSNPKAALKAIDKLVEEVEALQLTHWMYAFRFLRVSLSLEWGSNSEVAAVVKHLTTITATAEDQRHVSVQIVASLLEAIVHLRSGSTEAVDLAQRAMTGVRTHQLSSEMKQLPQMRALLHCLDATCAMLQYRPDEIAKKVQQMQEYVDKDTKDSNWSKDGALAVQLFAASNHNISEDSCNILTTNANGQLSLTFRFMSKMQMYALAYLLSGLAYMDKNPETGRAEKFLAESRKLTVQPLDSTLRSLPAVMETAQQQESLDVAVRLYKIFAYCGRHEYALGRKEIKDVRKSFAQTGSEIDSKTARILTYLDALCRQGLGDMQAAYELLCSPTLTFDPNSKATHAEKDLRVLAMLNSIFISRTLSAEAIAKADDTLSTIESYCLHHPNKSLLSTYHLVKATNPGPKQAIIKTKQYLSSAVAAAKVTNNQQLLCILMNLMTSMFFTNVVGEQAEKSALAGRNLAKKNKSRPWLVVADAMYGDIMEHCGRTAEAQVVRQEAESLVGDLPESLREKL